MNKHWEDGITGNLNGHSRQYSQPYNFQLKVLTVLSGCSCTGIYIS